MGDGTCTHTEDIHDVAAPSKSECEQCAAAGDSWVNLRICLTCGHVGCCDESKNRHATRHFEETGHPIIQSYELGETWRWCFRHQCSVPEADIPLRR